MPKQCFIENCRVQQDDPGCLNSHLFRVPEDSRRRQEWQNGINKYFNSNRVFTDYSHVCGFHFEQNCFNNNGMRVTLKKTALPTIFENYRDQKSNQDSTDTQNNKLDNEKPAEMQVESCSRKVEDAQDTFDSSENEQRLKMDVDSEPINNFEGENLSTLEKPANEISSIDIKATITSNVLSEKIFQKSIASVDLDSLDLDNKPLILRLLKNAQKEVEELRKSCKVKTSRLYRLRKRVKNYNSISPKKKRICVE